MKAHIKTAILSTLDIFEYGIRRIREAVKSENTPEPGVFMIQSWPGHDVQVDGCPLGMHCTYGQADAVAKAIAEHRPQTDKMGYARDRTREKEDAP